MSDDGAVDGRHKRIKMKKIHVKSLPLKDVIADLANACSVEVHRDCEVYTMHLPPSLGEGMIRGINFSSGLGLIHYDCTFEEEIELHFDVIDVHPVKVLCCLEGEIVHWFGEMADRHPIRTYQSAVVGSADHSGHVLTFPAKRHVVLASVEIDRHRFVRTFRCELDHMDAENPIRDLLTDVDAREEFFHTGHLSLPHWEALNSMQRQTWSGVFQRLFLQSKSTEILLWTMLEFDDDRLDDSKRNMVRKTEIEIIRRAAELIESRLSEPLTIERIAAEVGTNVNKLQEGFKYLYDTTVNGYVRKLRLEKTCHYLATTDMSVSEIVTKIGLTNHGYHSKIFKQTYGLSPLEYRNKIRNE